MEDFSRRLFGEDNEKDAEEESDIKKEKKEAARKIGAFAKQTTEASPRPEKSERKNWFFDKEKSGKEKEEDAPAGEEEPDKKTDPETTPRPEAIEAAKKEAAIAHIENELEEIEETPAEYPSDQAKNTVREFLLAVKERLQSDETSTDPTIEAEAERRLVVAAQEFADEEEFKDEENVAAEDTVEAASPLAGEIPLDSPESDEEQEPATIPLQPPTPIPPKHEHEGVEDLEDTTPTPATPPPLTSPTLLPSPSHEFHANSPIEGSDVGITPPPRQEASRPTPAHTENETVPTREHRSRVGGSLLLGYMIGRRGGRKRTEARLTPKINSLEQEKATTERLLESRERELQRVTIASNERTRQPGVAERPPAERPKANLEATPKRTTREIVRKTVVLPEHLQAAVASLERLRPKTETPPPPAVIDNEQVAPSSTETQKTSEKPTTTQPEKEVPKAVAIKKVEQLSTPELIKEAEHIYLDGASIRTLYNANRIDRAGLIKIVQESIRGGDINTVFKQVELGKERQRERAKEFRHDDSHTQATTPHATEPPKQVGRVVMQDIIPPTHLRPAHPKLHVPEHADSPELDATHQDAPTARTQPAKTALAVGAVIAIFMAVAAAIIL